MKMPPKVDTSMDPTRICFIPSVAGTVEAFAVDANAAGARSENTAMNIRSDARSALHAGLVLFTT
jgi:hypothetical protein